MSSASALPHQTTTAPTEAPKLDFQTQADGSYKRQVSSFRYTIEEGGEFPPEKGQQEVYLGFHVH